MNSHVAVKLPLCFMPMLFLAWCLTAADPKADEGGKPAPPHADVMLGKEPGQVRDDNDLRMKLVWCPPGAVAMEQMEQVEEPATLDDEAKQADSKGKSAREARFVEKVIPARVFLTHGYWLGKYEVTQSEWKRVMKTEPWKGENSTKEGDGFPATFVSWEDAMEFCRKLTKLERGMARLPDGWEYTLPTDAQWERACRARTETKFSFGDDDSELGDYAWIAKNTSLADEPYAHQVGQKRPNPWGFYDMHGNVLEWCRDNWTRKLPGGRDAEVQRDEKPGEAGRVVRGGGWGGIVAWSCRSAERFGITPRFQRTAYYGFRVALSSVQNANRAAPARRSTDN
jgi:formylglycine-generating enzyme required for sulfatase activity